MDRKLPIGIPERFLQKIDAGTYKGTVDSVIEELSSTIEEGAPFFPEYTLHGWDHVQTVLNYADKLIPQETFEALEDRDIVMLTCAVILHDLGMFLNKKGVEKLLIGDWSAHKTKHLDKHDWKTEWKQYIEEIRRFPTEKLLYHFGTAERIEEPEISKDGYSSLDTLIIGEFLRRHHHRIAHEIALDTMPGDEDLNVLEKFGERDRKWIGILARSHGMSIRKTRDCTSSIVGGGQQKLTYLMTVLRIADALDVGEGRVPNPKRKLKGIHTPISVQEWTWNARISDTDPEWEEIKDGRFICAMPTTTTEFVYLEKRLRAIQQELDACWALLWELRDYQKYRLSIHRIESDILKEDGRETFAESFVINEARLRADPELLKLLVEPLYESDPSCGVRELIQNAVDACIERKHIKGNGYQGEVTVSLVTKKPENLVEADDEWFGTLTVTDNGAGMGENVILNYYLSAGVSYRNSEEWLSKFAKGREPDIIRNGRFGVGVLATFLLGNEVEVKTWPMDGEKGYTFKFDLQPKSLDIKCISEKPENLPQGGTTITVYLKKDARNKLLEDYRYDKTWLNWYRFTDPAVKYLVDGTQYTVPFSKIPRFEENLTGWFELPGTGFEQVHWGYPHDGFFCNGIRIPWGMPVAYTYDDVTIVAPSVSVIDKKGHIPVDIARRFLDEGFPLLKAVERETARYAMAQLLTADWSSAEDAAVKSIPTILHTKSDICAPVVCSPRGYTLLHVPFLMRNWETGNQLNKQTRILILHIKKDAQPDAIADFIQKLNPKIPFIVHPEKLDMSDPQQIVCKVTEATEKSPFEALYYDTQCLWVYVPKKRREEEQDEKLDSTDGCPNNKCDGAFDKYPLNKKDKDKARLDEHIKDTDVCLAIAEVMYGVSASSKRTDRDDKKDDLWAFVDKFMRVKSRKAGEHSDPWIPYNEEERITKFSAAFETLAPYIPAHWKERRKNDA